MPGGLQGRRALRIALFHTTLPEPGRKLGGVEIAVDRIARALTEGRDVVTVFSLTPRPDGATYRHEQLFPGLPWLRGSKLARWFLLPLLLNFVDFSGFDVLHLHGDDWFYVLRRCPTVRTMHGSARLESRYATSMKNRVAQAVIYPLERLSVRLATIPVAVGTETAEIYGIEQTVDNGVDPSCFFPGPKAADPRVLFVGTWRGRKRGAWLHDVFVRRILPEVPNARLTFVSDAWVPHAGIEPVIFPDDARLAELYREAWVFACPSVYEGFGIPYVEALASGTAVVATPNRGAQRVLAEGRYGVLADDESFASRVLELLRDPQKRSTLEMGGLSRAAEFTWTRVAERHRDIFVRAASRWRGPA